MKRKVYLIASMVFLLSLFFAMSVSAGAANGSDDLTFKSLAEKTEDVLDENKIPKTYEGKSIYYTLSGDSSTGVWTITFYTENETNKQNDSTKVDIGSGFNNMFQGNKFLKEVNLTDECTEIPANAFEGCTALTTVTTGSNCDEIGSGAFSGCTSLESVGDIILNSTAKVLTIPGTWTSIGAGAFSGINSFDVIRWTGVVSTTAHIGDANHCRLTVAEDSHGATVLGDVNHAYTADNAVFVRAGTSLAAISVDDGYYVTANGTKLSDPYKMPDTDTTISAEKSSTETHTDSVKFSNVSISKYGNYYAVFYFDDGKSLTMSKSIGELFSDVLTPDTGVQFYINVTDIPTGVHVNNAKLVTK